jgi:7-cyano-7-deazaguanine synthase in queuosine biosynthesis
MTMPKARKLYIPEKKILVVEAGRTSDIPEGCISVELEHDICFSTAGLESWALANWNPIVYDALVLAAVIEYADRSVKRPPLGWARKFDIQIPVHAPKRWSASALEKLHDAVGFLTGDNWNITLVKRKKIAPSPPQQYLNIPRGAKAVLAYSNGLDSRAVAGLLHRELGDKLIRVRVSSGKTEAAAKSRKHLLFTSVPYSVSVKEVDRESSARNRGFRFSLISGIAAYLTNADKVIVPESGQGVWGPALVTVGHAYPDYRNHPMYLKKMTLFLEALLGKKINYTFPRLWSTKGETLSAYYQLNNSNDWKDTKSCWQGSRQASMNGKLRQCGICAACMLRRLSVHAAGLTEEKEVYICEDLAAPTLDAALGSFKKAGKSFREYALAGVLHMDHMADLADLDSRRVLERHAVLLGPILNTPIDDVEKLLLSLFQKHRDEWESYLTSLGTQSFLRQWTRRKND